MFQSYSETFIREDMPIEKAISVINKASEYRVALVVGDQNKLLGTVTDGDIRRAILKNIPLTAPVRQIMNITPFYLHESEEKQKIHSLLEKEGILQVPIVNHLRQVVGIETIHNVSKKNVFSNNVVIMAGGYGTRLRPLTDDCPKPMLSIGDKPILEHIISDFMSYGFNQYLLALHYLPEKIKGYFKDGRQWGVDIDYFVENSPLGTGGALPEIISKLDQEYPFFVINGDLLTKVHYVHLLNFHQLHKADITICVRKHNIEVPYGVVQFQEQRFIAINEKPVISHFVNAGIYLINPHVVNAVNLSPPYQMTDLIMQAKKIGLSVAVFPIHEYWADIGRMSDYQSVKESICATV